jgi:hypothetical protein
MMQLLTISMITCLPLILAQDGTFQAFSSSACDGDAGNVDFFDTYGRCVDTTGRHSFKLDGNNLPYKAHVILFENPGCDDGMSFSGKKKSDLRVARH